MWQTIICIILVVNSFNSFSNAYPKYDSSLNLYRWILRTDCDVNLSGIYDLFPVIHGNQPLKVVCDAETEGGGWTIVVRKNSSIAKSVNFNRTWSEYKRGFGDLDGEFFLGLDNIRALTEDDDKELRVILSNAIVKIDRFFIDNEDKQYSLHMWSAKIYLLPIENMKGKNRNSLPMIIIIINQKVVTIQRHLPFGTLMTFVTKSKYIIMLIFLQSCYYKIEFFQGFSG